MSSSFLITTKCCRSSSVGTGGSTHDLLVSSAAVAAAMSGIGTFDQTGSISAGLKSGAMNYGGGQLARYAGGAGFQGNPFGPMPALMATAEYVTKVHAICTRTGGLANHSFRTSENDSIVLLGEKESYEPLSRAAFYKANKQKKKDKE